MFLNLPGNSDYPPIPARMVLIKTLPAMHYNCVQKLPSLMAADTDKSIIKIATI